MKKTMKELDVSKARKALLILAEEALKSDDFCGRNHIERSDLISTISRMIDVVEELQELEGKSGEL